jgi:hypothetical protein
MHAYDNAALAAARWRDREILFAIHMHMRLEIEMERGDMYRNFICNPLTGVDVFTMKNAQNKYQNAKKNSSKKCFKNRRVPHVTPKAYDSFIIRGRFIFRSMPFFN